MKKGKRVGAALYASVPEKVSQKEVESRVVRVDVEGDTWREGNASKTKEKAEKLRVNGSTVAHW